MKRSLDINLGTVPPRTCLEAWIPAAEAIEAMMRGGAPPQVRKRYRCLDCGFVSERADAMRAHQAADPHTLWQRVRRFIGGQQRERP